MIKPTRADVASLASFDEAHFARWLHDGLNGYFLQAGLGRDAFPTMQPFIGQEADVVQDIAEIYRLLEVTEAGAFRAGLAQALSLTPLEDANIVVIEAMLNLASQIGASDVLSVISEKHRLNWLVEKVADEELFDATLRCVCSLSLNSGPNPTSDMTYGLLLDFIWADAFPSEYAEPVYVAMCRLRPEEAWSHLQAVRDHLDPHYAPLEDDTDDPAAHQERAKLRTRIVDRTYQTIARENFHRMIDVALDEPGNYDQDWYLMTAIRERRVALDGPSPRSVVPRTPTPVAREESTPPPAVDGTAAYLAKYFNRRPTGPSGGDA